MKKYIVIKIDTNDADYIESVSEIDDDLLNEFRPLIAEIKQFKPHKIDGKRINYNWVSGEMADYHHCPNYGATFSDELVDMFSNFIPYSEHGCHSIKSIRILEVINEEKLL